MIYMHPVSCFRSIKTAREFGNEEKAALTSCDGSITYPSCHFSGAKLVEINCATIQTKIFVVLLQARSSHDF